VTAFNLAPDSQRTPPRWATSTRSVVTQMDGS